MIGPGDIVRLRTGTLAMVVGEVRDEDATCYWMSEDQLSVGQISLAALVKLKRRARAVIGQAAE